jgi:opacity protein-like surface antigen
MTTVRHDVDRVAPAGHAPHRRLRRTAVLAGLAVVVAGGAVAAVAVRAQPQPAAGPLTAPGVGARVDDGVGVPSRKVGDTFCYGMVAVVNPSDRTAVLDRVTVEGGGGLRIGAARILGPDRADYQTSTWTGCPTGTAPLHGQRVPPGSGQGDDDFGLEVVLPITITAPGKHRITGTVVHYTVGGTAYRFTQPTDVVACTYACDARPGRR